MDTVSLLVYRRVRAAKHWIPLIALASIGLILLGVASPGSVVDLPQPATDPLLGPFRWMPISSNLG
jgi:hypothetical protein